MLSGFTPTTSANHLTHDDFFFEYPEQGLLSIAHTHKTIVFVFRAPPQHNIAIEDVQNAVWYYADRIKNLTYSLLSTGKASTQSGDF